MMDNRQYQKIYYQLAPSPAARNFLRQTCIMLDQSVDAELVDPDKWHLTVIHVGNPKPIWQQLKSLGNTLSFEVFEQAMEDWALVVKRRSKGKQYQLESKRLGFFGSNASVVAVVFDADENLVQDHQTSYQELLDTWQDLGINQPEMTMRSLRELKFAHKLTPHVTIAREGKINQQLPTIQQEQLSFNPMKFFYQAHE